MTDWPTEAYTYSSGYTDREGFKCLRCGKCCTDLNGYCFSVDDEQITYWKKYKPNLLRWIQYNEGWINPRTFEDVLSCPWYRNYKSLRYKVQGPACVIQKYKPPVCRDFPLSVQHAVTCFCRGFIHLPKEEIVTRIQNEVEVNRNNLKMNKTSPLRHMIQDQINAGMKAKKRVLNGEYTMEYVRQKYESK